MKTDKEICNLIDTVSAFLPERLTFPRRNTESKGTYQDPKTQTEKNTNVCSTILSDPFLVKKSHFTRYKKLVGQTAWSMLVLGSVSLLTLDLLRV